MRLDDFISSLGRLNCLMLAKQKFLQIANVMN